MKNKNALISAILGLVSGISYLIFLLIFISFISLGELTSGETANEQIGLIFVIMLILPIVFVSIIPSSIIGGVWQISRSVIYFTQYKNGKTSKTWVLVIDIILKILVGLVAIFGGILLIALSKYFTAALIVTETILLIVSLVVSFVAIGFEFSAKRI